MRANRSNVLDLLNISVAGMRDGVGPLLTVFLIQNTHWSPLHLSWVLAAPSIANILAQVPVGLLFDRLKFQGGVIAVGGVLMALSAFVISCIPSYELMILIQLLAGFACCLLSVGIPAVSLTMASNQNFGKRLARNEVFSKIGNFGAIAITGYLTQKYSLHWMFFVIYVLAFMVLINAMCLPWRGGTRGEAPVAEVSEVEVSEVEVTKSGVTQGKVTKGKVTKGDTTNDDILNHDIPSDQSTKDENAKVAVARTDITGMILKSLANPAFTKIVLIAFLYQLANASLFLIFEQSFVRQQRNGGAGIISASLFATQLVIIFGTLALARWKTKVNPIQILGFGFGFIILRSIVFALQMGLSSLFLAQILDGCIAAILIIVPVRAIAFLNDENFNVMSGTLGMCVALGAAISTILAGYMIGAFGYVPAFLTFGVIAAVGGCISFLKKNMSFSD